MVGFKRSGAGQNRGCWDWQIALVEGISRFARRMSKQSRIASEEASCDFLPFEQVARGATVVVQNRQVGEVEVFVPKHLPVVRIGALHAPRGSPRRGLLTQAPGSDRRPARARRLGGLDPRVTTNVRSVGAG